jgi:hypothetical protein
MLSSYLQLNHDLQKVETNKFILTLEIQMPTEYACAVLQEGKIIRFGKSNMLCYPTDKYAEGHLGGNITYDMDDEIANIKFEVQIHALPLVHR